MRAFCLAFATAVAFVSFDFQAVVEFFSPHLHAIGGVKGVESECCWYIDVFWAGNAGAAVSAPVFSEVNVEPFLFFWR